jgi:hypothetical protein
VEPPWSTEDTFVFSIAWDGETFTLDALKLNEDGSWIARIAPDGTLVQDLTRVSALGPIAFNLWDSRTDPASGDAYFAFEGLDVGFAGHARDSALPAMKGSDYLSIVPRGTRSEASLFTTASGECSRATIYTWTCSPSTARRFPEGTRSSRERPVSARASWARSFSTTSSGSASYSRRSPSGTELGPRVRERFVDVVVHARMNATAPLDRLLTARSTRADAHRNRDRDVDPPPLVTAMALQLVGDVPLPAYLLPVARPSRFFDSPGREC